MIRQGGIDFPPCSICLYETATEDGVTKNYHYLTAANGLFANFVTSSNGEEAMYYTLKDHQGSLAAVIQPEGNIEQELSFDAWGNLRDPETWVNYMEGEEHETPMFDRGFTGHEHLYAFGLINMNGRMYDPTMSSFLSVDAYVQSPDNSQAFNRYAYCWYNPLRYVDPTGWYMDNPKTDRALPPPDGDGIVDDGGNYSGNSSSGLVVYQDTFTRYDDGRCSIGYSYNGVGGVYCWDNWKRLFSDVPSTHGQGTTYSDPSYYYPTVSHNSNGSGGAGGGGGCGNGNPIQIKIQNVISTTNHITSSTGLVAGYVKWDFDNPKNIKAVDEMCQNWRSKGLASKNLSGVQIGKNVSKTLGKTGNALGWAGLALCGVDIAISGEICPSDIYGVGGAILCIGLGYFCASTPVGWIAGAVFLTADYVSWRWTGETIGGHFDNATDWRFKF